MSEPYFTEIYLASELTINLNALVNQGYEIITVLPAGEHQGQMQVLIVAKKVEVKP